MILLFFPISSTLDRPNFGIGTKLMVLHVPVQELSRPNEPDSILLSCSPNRSPSLVPLASYPPQAIVEASHCYSHLPENEKVLHHNPDCVTVTTMEQKLAEVSDIFDSVVCLDESLRQEGFEDGYKDGLVAGKEEGKEVGLKMGFQVAEELGFYQGCVDVWNSVIQVDSGAFSSRLQKTVQQLGDLLRRYPLLDPENEQVQEMMDAIRLKVRIISANMGVKLEYKGFTKSSTQGMEDM